MSERSFIGFAGVTEKESIPLYEGEPPVKNTRKTNVVYIVLDDVGFAQLGCYGSNIETPNINKLAEEGLRYNNFHTTAICSATRASLLTGANHQKVGVGQIVNFENGFPNAIGHIKHEYATIAEVLKENGYATYAVGKWHLTPMRTLNNDGDPAEWPLQRGFDRFYGFLNACTDQYYPDLTKDNSPIDQPKLPTEGYHLSEDLSDHAIDYLYHHKLENPDQPFFLYLAYGAGHGPHQAPKKYIEKYKGRFDEGWDVIRQKWFEHQKEIGIIPANTDLTARNEYVPEWDSLSDDEKKLFTKYMEVFAGFLDHTDEQIGRVVDYIDSIGERDNTVIVLLSDNGASAEGGQYGRFVSDEVKIFNREDEVQFALEHYDDMGGEFSSETYPIGWANAGDTPFQWYKSWVHAGGVKDPLIIRFPDEIRDGGGIRTQFHHVSDITPTILDILGIRKPESIKGVHQEPVQGTSLRYTFGAPDAPTKKLVQYFEHEGNRGIWKDGWKLVTNHMMRETFEEDHWELYHVDDDYSEAHDLSDQYPELVERLKELWFIEAARNDVFPMTKKLHNYLPKSYLEEAEENLRLCVRAEEKEYRDLFAPFMANGVPALNARNYTLTFAFEHHSGKEGVLYQAGDRFAGHTLFVRDNKLHFTYNFYMRRLERAEADLPEGKNRITLQHAIHDRDVEIRVYINTKEAFRIHTEAYGGAFGFGLWIKDGKGTSPDPELVLPFEYGETIDIFEIKAADYEISRVDYLDEFFALD
ncbi:MAG: arylsulfatase [Eubacterium sp.]|nr:arylsulfatase [Eubacterium sp.]